ncbi:hypothetical protein [Nostoc parmelioides]|uniref:hypothetical protein n=1 Tax=Nostoc parmelioides TaxID=1521621 RepID=UPI00168508EB|nr:hypothetical protein [Nostoc parmelioides]
MALISRLTVAGLVLNIDEPKPEPLATIFTDSQPKRVGKSSNLFNPPITGLCLSAET